MIELLCKCVKAEHIFYCTGDTAQSRSIYEVVKGEPCYSEGPLYYDISFHDTVPILFCIYSNTNVLLCFIVCHCVFVCISRGFGQSNSLPTTSCVGSSVSARRSLRQFQMPSRSLPGARLLGSGGLLGPTPRSSSSTPTGPKQGRQVRTYLYPNRTNIYTKLNRTNMYTDPNRIDR